MIKHFLIGILRQAARQKTYTTITIIGLAIGLASFLVTASWIRFETGFDSNWLNHDRIARVIGSQQFAADGQRLAALPFNLAPVLAQEFPEFEQVARVQSPASLLFAVDDRRFYETSVFYADSNILEIFDLPLRFGQRASALNGPNQAILSAEAAEKYFGSSDPIGKSIRIDNRDDLAVTGVMEPLPFNISFRPNILVTMNTHATVAAGTYLHDWRTNAYGTFVLIADGANATTINSKIRDVLSRYRPDGTPPQLSIQPIREVHLTPNLQGDFAVRSSKLLLWVFGATALAVLIIACVNYTNLATARAISREREIGVRKALGADRMRLMMQFFGESLVASGLAMIVAIVTSEFIVIGANRWFDSNLRQYFRFDWPALVTIVGTWLVTSIGAGLYPALHLSSLRSALAIRSSGNVSTHPSALRASLVILQFVASIALIIGTVTIYRQLNYFNSRDIGFDKDQIVTVALPGQELKEKVPALKAALGSHSAVKSVTAIGALPSSQQQSSASFNWEGGPPDKQLLFNLNVVDEDYLETFGLELASGRNFGGAVSESETSMPCIINETAAKSMGWDEAVGRNIIQPPELKINVIGVVKDYNYASLHLPIRPLMLYMDPSRPTNMAIKISTSDLSATLVELEKLWSEVVPERPFNYSFLDVSYAKAYQAEQQAGRILLLYTAIAIAIACLELISLASYRIARRTKETGIRKVLGASIASIVVLHTKEFVLWILVANVIAWPIGYLAIEQWLQNFAYRVDVSWWSLAFAGFGALLIALLTVAIQTLKSATSNPVKSLRYE